MTMCKTSPAPTIAKYNASPVYQIICHSSDYKTSDTATSLNTSSNLVRALQGGPSGCQQGLDGVVIDESTLLPNGTT